MNLVRLLGYCLDEKQVLIYEFAEEGSIWDHLQGQNHHLLHRNGEVRSLLLFFQHWRYRDLGVFECECLYNRIDLCSAMKCSGRKKPRLEDATQHCIAVRMWYDHRSFNYLF